MLWSSDIKTYTTQVQALTKRFKDTYRVIVNELVVEPLGKQSALCSAIFSNKTRYNNILFYYGCLRIIALVFYTPSAKKQNFFSLSDKIVNSRIIYSRAAVHMQSSGPSDDPDSKGEFTEHHWNRHC